MSRSLAISITYCLLLVCFLAILIIYCLLLVCNSANSIISDTQIIYLLFNFFRYLSIWRWFWNFVKYWSHWLVERVLTRGKFHIPWILVLVKFFANFAISDIISFGPDAYWHLLTFGPIGNIGPIGNGAGVHFLFWCNDLCSTSWA